MRFSVKNEVKHLFYALRIITPIRLWNLLKLGFSFYWSRVIRKPYIAGMPWSLSVEPSGFCNLQCPECPLGAGVLTRTGYLMTTTLFTKILDDAGPGLMWVNLFFQGEPMINPHVSEMITQATKRNIYTCISTNGHFLSEKHCHQLIDAGVSQLIVSLDGITPETYSHYRRGGDFLKVQEGVKRIVEIRNQSGKNLPYIIVQFVVFKHNEHEIDRLANWCKSAGVDRLNLKSAQINNFGIQTVAPSSIAQFSRYSTLPNGSLKMKNKSYNHCSKQWGSLVISCDGQLAPCCYDKDLKYSPGNINQESLKSLWYSKQLIDFRKMILTSRKNTDICQNCPEGRSRFF